MLNSVILCGRVTKDMELKKTNSNKSVVSFTLACEDYGKTEFINCVAWNQSAEYLSEYGHKGDVVLAAGKITNRKYTDADGRTVWVTEVTCNSVKLIGGKKKEESNFKINDIDVSDEFADLPWNV